MHVKFFTVWHLDAGIDTKAILTMKGQVYGVTGTAPRISLLVKRKATPVTDYGGP
jgi:hypothetical protein